MVAWVGFKQTAVIYDRPGRYAGDSKYPIGKMIRFALDGITSFSMLPLRFSTYLGMALSCISLLYAAFDRMAQALHDREVGAGVTPTTLRRAEAAAEARGEPPAGERVEP